MCQFFSLISDGLGTVYYLSAKDRAKLCNNNPKCYEPDSHSSIAAYHDFANGDKMNKYEYNPLTKEFTIDQINARKDDRRQVKKACLGLDFATIVPELILKPFFHPLIHKKRKRVSQIDIDLLKKWASVRDSVWDSVKDSVWAYTSSFFNLPKWKYIKHEKGKNPFQPCIDLWHRGIVASFDGTTWRLHGHKGKILKEITQVELNKNGKCRKEGVE